MQDQTGRRGDGPSLPDGRPPRPARPRPERPELPDDVASDLPRKVHGELRQHVRDRERFDDVAVAMTVATRAIEDDEPVEAVPLLEWCKDAAPRSPVVRETLAIARYLTEDFAGALSEVRAYRRLSASHDQDHLLADCLRATGRSPAEVGEVVEAMLASDAPADRQVEGVLVWANAVADAGDLAAARAALRRADRDLLEAAGPDARDRRTYVVADLAERAGDVDAARRGFEQLAALEDDPYRAASRLAALRERT